MSTTTNIFPKSDSKGEAIANSLTHGLGVGLSILGLILLIYRAVNLGTVWHVVSFTIYGVSLILLYLASTVYHSTPAAKPWNRILQRLDHAAIYVLIAGTYTPFMLTTMRGPLGWSILGIVWGIALIGLVLKIGFPNRFKNPTVVLYVIMGWLFVLAFREAATQIEFGQGAVHHRGHEEDVRHAIGIERIGDKLGTGKLGHWISPLCLHKTSSDDSAW